MSAPAVLLVLPALALACAACGTPGRTLQVDVPSARSPSVATQMGEEVGRLLSPDPEVSRAAEGRLLGLDPEGRERLIAYAATLEAERDVRLLNVLDEHHALPEMPAEDTLDFLLWKGTRPERYYVIKAQSRLMDMARSDPAPLVERLRREERGFGLLAVVLALNDRREAVPPLLARYRTTADVRERRAAAEALARLVPEHAPRAAGPPAEIARDAEAIDAWFRKQQEAAAETKQEARDG